MSPSHGTSAFVLVAASLALACGQPEGSAPGTDGGAATSSSSAVTAARGGDCVTCHLEEYEHVKEPPHVDVKPTTCGVCHVQEGWRPSVLHHDWWQLAGAHKGRPDTQCAWCHKGKPAVFKGTPKECVACHQEDYDSSTFPEHATFQKKCTDCHSTDAWRPAKPPPPRAAPPLAAPTPSAPPSKLTPKGKPVKTPTPTRPAGTQAPAPLPIPRPAASPTTRPPDVISRPSRR